MIKKTFKQCTKCKVNKPLNEFYKNKANNDGLSYLCKECKKAYMNKYSKINKQPKPDKKEKDKNNKLYRKLKLKLIKINAHIKVRRAVRVGLMTKTIYCQHCHALKPLRSHHEDYSKPLDVIWLCEDCYKKLNNKQ